MHNSDTYKWKATLDSGLEVHQVDTKGNKYAYEDLPHEQVRSFELLKDGITKLKVLIRPGEKFVWRRRTEMSPGQSVVEICHILAKKVNGRWNTIGVFESDGHTEMVPDFLPNHAWFYPPQLREFE